MKIINREEICSACLEYQFPLLKISDDYIKEVYKSFTGDYQTNIELYLCNYCKHSFVKISKFINMCVQSYAFLTRNIQSLKFNSHDVAEEKASVQNSTDLNRSNTIHISVPCNKFTDYNNSVFTIIHDEDIPPETQFINLNLKKESIDKDSNDPLATCIDNDEIEYPVRFKQETMQSTSKMLSEKYAMSIKHDKKTPKESSDFKIQIKQEILDDDSDDSCAASDNEEVELPVEFDNEVASKKANSESPGKVKTPTKKDHESAKINENIIQIKLNREEQVKELEEKRQSEKYLQAIYKCEKCVQIFGLEISLKKHNMMKHDESRGSYECWLCHTRFLKSDLLKTHCLNHSTKLFCKLCNYESHEHRYMKYHLEWHAGVTHTCHLCDKVFKYPYTLRNHLKAHKLDKTSRSFKCQQCDKAFYSKNSLHIHENIHTDNRPYTCETCGKAFKTKGSLNLHVKIHNEITGEHYCVECDKYFKSEFCLKYHFNNCSTHADSLLLKFDCKQCPKMFISQKKLDSHIQASHDKIPRFPCDICGAAYTTQSSRSHHKRRVHQGYVMPLKYGCTTCDKHFNCKQTLDKHIRTHTGERPFKCTLCDWKFTQKAALKTHIKLKHLNIKNISPAKKSKKIIQ